MKNSSLSVPSDRTPGSSFTGFLQTTVAASDIDNSKRFDLKEEAELFALDKDIVCYEIITIAVHSKRKK